MIPLPAFITTRLLVGVAVASGLVLSGWFARAKWDENRFTKLKLEQTRRIADAEKRARELMEAARARENELIAKTQEIADEARKAVVDLERSRAVADAASVSMLDAARRATSRCSPGPSATTSPRSLGTGMSGSMSDGDRLMRVLGELDGAAGAYAEDSGRARAARNACEQAYTAAMKAVNR